MGRTTVYNHITTPELIEKINPKNKRLVKDYLNYLSSIQRSKQTIHSYKNDLEIFFVWNLQNNDDKEFVKVTKRDIISYQSYLINENKNSPARVRRLKSCLSSLSNYIADICDDEYEDFRPIVRRVENPVNVAVREKTVLSDEQIDKLLHTLVENKEYMQACTVALGAFSGSRKSELLRFKASYFTDDNIIYGSLYKTPEKIKTKGRGLGKFIYRYTLANDFKPYLDLWLNERKELGVDNDYLFVHKINNKWEVINKSMLDSWTNKFSEIIGEPFYFHSLRHHFVTNLSQHSIPRNIIQSIVGWENEAMISVYDDSNVDDELSKYFDKDGIKQVKETTLSDLK